MTILVDRFLRSKVGKEFEQQDAAELLGRRKALVTQIADLEAKHLAALPGLVDKEAAAAAKVQKAEEALEGIRAAHREVVLARMQVSNTYDSARGPLEGELRSTASPLIDRFVGEMRILFETVRRESPSSPPLRPFAAFPDPDDAKAADERNRQQVARLARIRQARDTAPTLKLEALTPTELAERLDALRRSVSEEAG